MLSLMTRAPRCRGVRGARPSAPAGRAAPRYHALVAKLLINLRGVPDDEAEEIRELRDEHGIAYYETPPSRWGVSAGGIWLRRREDIEPAERLMAEYQRRRAETARARYRAAALEGLRPSIWMVCRENPVGVIAALIGIAFAIGLLALPFVLL